MFFGTAGVHYDLSGELPGAAAPLTSSRGGLEAW